MNVLSEGIFTLSKERFVDVKILKDIVGGDVVYEANSLRRQGCCRE
jgi:predicted amidohydrolase YtcJ